MARRRGSVSAEVRAGDPKPSGPRTVLDDTGSAHLGCFVGWVPGAIAAVISGIVVGIDAASFQAFVLVVVVGTAIGHGVCLGGLFTIGFWASKLGLSPRAADIVFWALFLSGAPAAIVVAVLVRGMYSS